MRVRRRLLTPILFLLLAAAVTRAQAPVDVEAYQRCLSNLGEGTSYVFVVDASGSMEDEDNDIDRLEAVKQSARGLVRTMHEEDEVALFKFQSCGVDRLLEFTRDKQRFLDVLQTITAGGDTSLAMGIEEGGNYLLSQAVNARRSLVVLTDGEESCGGNPEIAMARFREQLALADAAEANPEKLPKIESISFVNTVGEPLDDVSVGGEFTLRVVMSATSNRCVYCPPVTIRNTTSGVTMVVPTTQDKNSADQPNKDICVSEPVEVVQPLVVPVESDQTTVEQ